MFIRQLEYLVTLARERHFARAAEICCVSQPALSAGIRHLEEELGVSIVQRGHRYVGLSPEGERILEWAKRRLPLGRDCAGSIERRAHLNGTLRIGAIPTTIPIVPFLTGPYRAAYPEMHQLVQSLSSEEIVRRLDSFDLDLGLTYLEDEPLEGFRVWPLYRERYVLLAKECADAGKSGGNGWAEAATLPLCLLTENMQNRRIITAAFRRAQSQPLVVIETDSIFALYSHVLCADVFSIVPHSLLSLLELRQELTAIPLVPELTRPIGLIALQHDPLPPIVAAAWATTQSLDLETIFAASSNLYRQRSGTSGAAR